MEKLEPKQAYELLSKWQQEPKLYFQDVLGVTAIWKLQDEMLRTLPRAIKERKPIYVASGHSLGKDWVCGGIALWFLQCFPKSIVIQTAPTDRQVKKVMWGETMAHWNKRKLDLGGKAYKIPYLEIIPEDWYMIGFTTKESGASKEAEGGKFQGFHAPYIAVIVSEAQAVEDDIFDQIDAVTTSQNVLIIYIGNPTRASGRFAKGLRDKVSNIVYNFSCLDNPNYQQKKEVIPGLCAYEWVEDKRKRWGEEDPRWYGRVLGQIPSKSINNVFSESDIELGQSRGEILSAVYKAGTSLDVAGEGDDENVLYAGVNGMIKDQLIKTNQAPSTNAINCQTYNNKVNGTFIIVDCDGMGIKEYQELNRITGLSDKVNLIKYHGCARIGPNSDLIYPTQDEDFAEESIRYENLRALAWFITLRRVRDGLAAIPNDPILVEELLETKWFENSRGKIQIEDKDDIKDRIGRSPDRADAFVMLQYGFYLDLEPMVNDEVVYSAQDRQGMGQKVVHEEEYEPDYAGY